MSQNNWEHLDDLKFNLRMKYKHFFFSILSTKLVSEDRAR